MTDENKIRDAADAIKGIVQAVPVYQDVIQPAAKEVGTALQTVAKTLHILLAPLAALVWGYDQVRDFVSTCVADKLKGVPPERLIAPAANIAGPALEALRYTGHDASLREMYAKLLASSMDSKTAHQAHPAFVDVIKQLSPDEAQILSILANRDGAPLISVRQERKHDRLGNWVLRHFSLLPEVANCKYPDLGPNYLTNLERLGLVELRESYQLKPEGTDLYQPLLNHGDVKLLLARLNESKDFKAHVSMDAVLLTPFGLQFCEACVSNDTH